MTTPPMPDLSVTVFSLSQQQLRLAKNGVEKVATVYLALVHHSSNSMINVSEEARRVLLAPVFTRDSITVKTHEGTASNRVQGFGKEMNVRRK